MGATKYGDLRQAGVTKFWRTVAKIAEAKKGVFVGCEFAKKPCRGTVGGEEFYDWLVIALRDFGQVCVVAKSGAKFAGEQHVWPPIGRGMRPLWKPQTAGIAR